MKKLFRFATVAAVVAAVPALVSAQDKQFDVGTKILHVGLAVGDEAIGGIGVGAGFEVGAMSIANGVVRLGIGGEVAALHNTYGSGYVTQNTIPVLLFVNGHYQLEQVPKLDLLAGPVLGMTHYSRTFKIGYCSVFIDNCDTSHTDVSVGIQAGARYELTSAIAGSLLLSAGSNVPWANIGIAFKF